MHFIQALKMACKSLWSNKMRSFLTMLGIIIGVVTVALLTSVASGVSGAVVSSIRSQSTLAVMMNTSKEMTVDYVNYLLSSNQHEKSDADYYDYSLVYSSNAIIASDLTNATINDDFVNEYLFVNNKYSQIDYDSLSEEEKRTYEIVMMSNQKKQPTEASINAVTKNFLDVYEMKIEGEFPKQANEVLVDKEFLSYYLDYDNEVDIKQAIGESFSIGVNCYTNITLRFKSIINEDLKKSVKEYITMNSVADDLETEDINEFRYRMGLGEILSFNVADDEKMISLNVKYFSNQTNESIINQLTGNYVNPMKPSYVAPEFVDLLEETNAIEVKDIYDISNQKVYTISGIFDDSESLMSSSSDMIVENNKPSIFDLYTLNNKGSIYMLLDESNLNSITLGKNESVGSLLASYAYLRFKTEDVMDERVNDLTLSLISTGKIPMQHFMLISMSSVASIVSSVMNILTVMLTVISIVSLIVGGIGIMNIMLVAVTERTREIGIRKAIGAKKSAILVQFLVEALMLSIVGGTIGLGLSALGCLIIGNAMGIVVSMPLWVIGMSLGFCTAIGLIFGMFPAIKASKMQPIDALRKD